ncbi:uncharacterized protein LOC141972777 [Athene noctua]|uniref:uncharacterized protein LOC141972777 n=1 Tax=Athene noctua TaxID=126797 RepID=UPI003EB93A21
MPAEPKGPGVATEIPPPRPIPRAPPKKTRGGWGAQHPPASDSEKDSGFSDTSSEHLSGREQTDAEEPPGTELAQPLYLLATTAPSHPSARLAPVYLVHNLLLQQTLGAPPEPWQPAQLLLIQPPLPAAPHPAATAPAGTPECPNRHRGVTAELLRWGGVLAAALRTGALLRQNRRTQREIATLRRHARLLARAARDPRAWLRLCDALGGWDGGSPVSPGVPRQGPPAVGEGLGAGGL